MNFTRVTTPPRDLSRVGAEYRGFPLSWFEEWLHQGKTRFQLIGRGERIVLQKENRFRDAAWKQQEGATVERQATEGQGWSAWDERAGTGPWGGACPPELHQPLHSTLGSPSPNFSTTAS